MNTTTTWQKTVNYGAGDVVYYNGKRYKRLRVCLNVTTKTPDISTYWQLLPEEEQIAPINNYHSLIEERDKAVQLLTKVCEYVTDTLASNEDKGGTLSYLDEIDGLVEWWLKRKPKSEREQKLEKIKNAIQINRNIPISDLQIMAERILQEIEGT